MRLAFIKLGCLLYEGLILIALAMLITLLFIVIVGDATQYPKKAFLQLSLWLTIGWYFVRQWSTVGQTLAMKTWKLKIVQNNGLAISKPMAVKRYVLASLMFGLGFLWALFDKEGQYLHDRIANTHIIRV